MSQTKRKRDLPARPIVVKDVLHFIPLVLETEKEMEQEKICGLDVLASTLDNVEDDVDKKASDKKKKGQQKSKKGELKTHNQMTKNEHSGKNQIEISEAGKGRGQGSVSKGSRQKSGVLRNFQFELPATKPKVWTSDEEIVLLSEILGIMRSGNGLPLKKSSEIDWDHLSKKVSKRLDGDLTRTQVYEKARRLKTRYSALEQKLNAGALNSFKTVSEEEIYTLSLEIWGHCKSLRLHLEEDDEDPVLATENKQENVLGHNAGSQHDDSKQLEETVQITTEGENQDNLNKSCRSEYALPSSKLHEKKLASFNACQNQKEKPVEDMGRDSATNTMSWNAQRMLEIFHSEHQAFVKEVQDSCQLVLEEMQVKLVTMVNNVVTEAASQFPPWVGGMHLASFPSVHPSISGSPEESVGNFVAANRLECTKPAIENLKKRWQQQRLEELKLTSGRLRLLLEECQMQQDKLERDMRKS